MKRFRTSSGIILVFYFCLLPSIRTVSAEQTEPGLNLKFLLQSWIQLVGNGAADGESLAKDAYLRRARMILSGRLNKRISFFAETDFPNWGKSGNWSGEFFIQDAYIDFLLAEKKGFLDRFHVSVGMIILPFSHHNRQSAVSLNTLDYHSLLIRFPKDSHKIWRDSGIELRGLFFGNRLDIKLGLFNGVKSVKSEEMELNPSDAARVTGRAQWNFLDSEEGFFYGGNSLGSKKIASLGLGMDYQKDAVFAGMLSPDSTLDYFAWTADAFLDFPFSQDWSVNLQSNFFHYDHGREFQYSGLVFPVTGNAYGLEWGIRFRKLEPVFSYERFDPRYSSGKSLMAENYRFGVNIWLDQHRANLKAEYGLLRSRGDFGEVVSKVIFTLQTQIFF